VPQKVQCDLIFSFFLLTEGAANSVIVGIFCVNLRHLRWRYFFIVPSVIHQNCVHNHVACFHVSLAYSSSQGGRVGKKFKDQCCRLGDQSNSLSNLCRTIEFGQFMTSCFERASRPKTLFQIGDWVEIHRLLWFTLHNVSLANRACASFALALSCPC
jgi:hypothetical protein